jgi:hypothetical protein
MGPDELILCAEDHSLQIGLCNDQAIERIIRPKQDMRVDQQPREPYSKYFCSSGGRGPSKSSAM